MSSRAHRLKQYVSAVGLAVASVGSPSGRHRSMQCSCEAERWLCVSSADSTVFSTFGRLGNERKKSGAGAESPNRDGSHCDHPDLPDAAFVQRLHGLDGVGLGDPDCSLNIALR